MKINKLYVLIISIFFGMATSNIALAGTAYTTMNATNITAKSATLNGKGASTLCKPNGMTFHWGTNKNSLDHSIGGNPLGGNVKTHAKIKGLTCNTTYYFQLTGNVCPPRTTIQGAVLSFKTEACPRKYEDVEAGPIWNQQDAEAKCPNACATVKGTWSGQWLTTEPGVMSVCGCWVNQ